MRRRSASVSGEGGDAELAGQRVAAALVLAHGGAERAAREMHADQRLVRLLRRWVQRQQRLGQRDGLLAVGAGQARRRARR